MTRILALNSRGREVTMVQQALNRFVVPKLVVDGFYGPKTENAVRRFQHAAGFKGKQIDGVVGPKTSIALFQIFDLKITGTLTPKANAPSPPPAKPPVNLAVQPPKPMPATVPPPDEIPRRFQANAQLGYQNSQRDGQGLQAILGVTVRSKDYFPNSAANTIYHGLHTETLFQSTLGIPLPPSSIYTGQLSVTSQPITDWLVLYDRLHLFTPAFGAFGQIPLNSPGGADPSSHPRLGLSVGAELFHFDIIKDHLAIGVSGQESGYWDFTNRRFYFDPSFLIFLNGSFGFGPDAK